MADAAPSFWQTIVTSGVNMAGTIVKPLGSGLTNTLGNLVQTGQNKVAGIAQTIVQTTDPNAANKPAAPPTTSTKPAQTAAQLAAAAAQTKTLIIVLAGLVALFFFMRKK